MNQESKYNVFKHNVNDFFLYFHSCEEPIVIVLLIIDFLNDILTNKDYDANIIMVK